MAENTRRRRTEPADRRETTAAVPDPQVETVDEERFEVLTETPNGHRTVHRVRAKDQAAAEKAVADLLDVDAPRGAVVVAAAPDGSGLGSGARQ